MSSFTKSCFSASRPHLANNFFTSSRHSLLRFRQPASTPRLFSQYHRPASERKTKALIWTIIGANAAVFMAWQGALPNPQASYPGSRALLRKLDENFVLGLRNLREGRVWTLITSAFSHVGFNHFAANMFSFHVFSSVVAGCGIPTIHVAILAVGSALGGSLGHLLYGGYRHRNRDALGASGMVSGMGAAAALLAPRTTMLLMFVLPVRLWMLVLGYAAFDTYMLDNPNSRIGHSAHLSGMAFGVAYFFLRLRRFGGVRKISDLWRY